MRALPNIARRPEGRSDAATFGMSVEYLQNFEPRVDRSRCYQFVNLPQRGRRHRTDWRVMLRDHSTGFGNPARASRRSKHDALLLKILLHE